MIYIAFLRGINVGGNKIIKMDDLKNIFESLGFKNVTTYIQSGNVSFETSMKSIKTLTPKIETSLHKALGYEVAVFLRTKEEMQALVKSDPFKKVKASDKGKTYVTFLQQTSEVLKNLDVLRKQAPMFSPKKDVEVIGVRGCDVFCLPHQVDGKFGFPNAFIEKELGVPATTRNWTTVCKMAE